MRVVWKVEIKSDKLGFLAKDISKKNVKGMVCFFILLKEIVHQK